MADRDPTIETRVFLTRYMLDNFKDATFATYINDDLAGDFAFNLANALRAPIQPVATQEDAGNVQAVQTSGDEVARPDLIEKLIWHTHECDDLTLDEALDYLAQGWKKVHGRTERQLILQIVRLFASQPSNAVKPFGYVSDQQVAYQKQHGGSVSLWLTPFGQYQTPIYDAPAATVPPVVQVPSDEQIASLNAEIKRLHVKLAGETLRADQGWERYEAANKSHMACVNERAALLTTASNAGEAMLGEDK